jgi:glycosyltransferase involved in cell wall biosynthesis
VVYQLLLIIKGEVNLLMKESKYKAQKKLAIIIPCYNCEKTIENCLNSIGVHDNVRVIAVNDCSKDSTLKILEEYKHNNNQFDITIVNNNYNMGPGQTRNAGLEVVNEDYLMFLDADDVLDVNYYYALNGLIENSFYDCMIFRAKRIVKNKIYEFNMFLSDKIKYGELGKETIALIKGCPWGKVYRASIIKDNGILFADLYRAEDMVFTKTAMARCKTIKYFENVLYWYIDTPGSIMNSKYGFNIDGPERAYSIVNNTLKNSGMDAELNSIYFFEVLYEGTISYISNGASLRDSYNYFKEKSQLYCINDKYYNLYSLKYKLIYKMMKYQLMWIFIVLRKV